ncbi:NAD(P)-dependent oxidoreductase [Chitinophaga nivalis]|uniref:NAD(P)-binding domain-containing protein n=1 Tax=Chitinophaga nivalis TaxID=2991709 RepID=A0ABT3ILA2_9BACT|nr:NAD(P)-binding domain-containing protein [Chitinophaga nivalis]MCW3465785.1 NAD(P)-binding domain-containing protein [Chitinophaga nivalis]MCW3484524.1 NAD(P)-binding domain-containing protein [Chitinophaga nivalis]
MTTTPQHRGAVTVIGLGAMGTVLARTLLQKGFTVTIWNRTAARAAGLTAEGALLAPDITAAVAASPIIITCLSSYEATSHLLQTAAIDLTGKTIIEFCTGTPQDARNAQAWVTALGGSYLDGALMATPRQIGQESTTILVAGATDTFQTATAVLAALGGNVMYKGEAIGAAAAWDLGLLASVFGMINGFMQGALLFESEGIPVNLLGNMLVNMGPIIGEMVRHEGEVIVSGNYDHPESSLRTCAYTFDLLVKQANEAGIDSSIPAFSQGLFKRALDAGYGEEQLGALIKVLRTQA